MFGRILVANRGEIACRIVRTARRMGVGAVAVHSDADADARHVRLADEAFAIGGAAPADSYLRGDAIIEAALRSGAEAVHPGYGFLAENAGFAEECARAGLVFVGPPPEAVRAMGEKDSAKRLMEAAGVPVLRGWRPDTHDLRAIATQARMLGFPVLVKAVAGGGGRGMRVVEREIDIGEALAAARREALAAFGDDRVMIEKLMPRARHVEVQICADTHGAAVHLFERDCSVQRRYQKTLEEAPSPAVGPELRAALGDAAVRGALAAGYVGAGTVEFLLDDNDRFYFMEMNARLQVEHPVTEAVTGVDLVEWQLRIAAGEPLPLAQDSIVLRGHAIEARLCAEDPARDFLPATGRLARFRLPPGSAHLRFDSGAVEGDMVTPHYDSLLVKAIAHGADRESALRRLALALDGVELAGPATNLDWLRAAVRHPAFVSGRFDTGFVATHRADLLSAPAPAPDTALAAAALFVLLDRRREARRAAAAAGAPHSPWAVADGWRLNAAPEETLRFVEDGETRAVALRPGDNGETVMGLPGGDMAVSGAFSDDGRLRIRAGEVSFTASVARRDGAPGRALFSVAIHGSAWTLEFEQPLAAAEAVEEPGGRLTAPMPGRIVRVWCDNGARVARGAPLLTVEAMKMEHTVAAPSDGRIARVKFAVGDWVDEGESLVDFDAAPDSA